MGLISKIKKKKWVLRSIFSTIYFNFHYLPFRQAIKLPIFLYKPHFRKLKGKISIMGGVKTGMIELGRYQVALYPNSGLIYSNSGGHIIFLGKCCIGNNSAIAIGKNGKVVIGDGFYASTSFKLAVQYHVTFDSHVMFGWDCLVMDSDYHKLTKVNGGFTKGYGEILIGANTWCGNGVLVLKNSIIPSNCVVGAKSVVSNRLEIPPYSLVCGTPAKLVKQGVWRDPLNDIIKYD